MISYEHSELFLESSVNKNWKIQDVNDSTFYITNQHLDMESIELYESLMSESVLTLGTCESSTFSFTTRGINIPMKDKVLKVTITFNDYPDDPFTVGTYKVISDEPSFDRTTRKVVCQDMLYDVLNTDYSSWYNSRTFSSLTLESFITQFMTACGLTVDSASLNSLVNKSMAVTKTLDTNTLLGRDILTRICEANGCFGHMTRDNKFKFIYLEQDIQGLYPANDLYPSDTLYPKDPKSFRIDSSNYYPPLGYSDWIVEPITGLTIRENDSDVGLTISGNNIYTITNNFLLFDKTTSALTTIANNILSKVSGITYRTCNIKARANLCLEVGDAIRVSNDSTSVESYIFVRKMTGLVAIKDNYISTGEQKCSKAPGTSYSYYEQLSGRTLKIKADVDGIETEVTDLASQTSTQISQLSDRINFKVSQGEIMSGLASETAYSAIEITPNRIAVSSSGTFTVDSENFKLDSDGHVILTDGEIELVGGSAGDLYIDAENGFVSYNYRGDSTTIASGEITCGSGTSNTTLYGGYLMLSGGGSYFTEIDGGTINFVSANISNGGIGNNHALRSVYWRKVVNLSDDEYVICGA